MSRRRERINYDWETPPYGPTFKWEHVQLEVLMDIREKLSEVVLLLRCPNVRAGFEAMQRMDRRMAKAAPKRRKS